MTESDRNRLDPPQVGSEPDILPLGKLFIWVGMLCAVLIGMVVVLWQYFNATALQEVDEKVATRSDPLLAEVQAQGMTALNSWDVVDAEKGLYRMPVAEAMALLVKNPALLEPEPAPPAKPPPAKPPPAKPVVEPEQAAPGQATQPAAPGQATQPAAPGQGTQPAAPGQATQPAAPGQGAQPGQEVQGR